MTFTRIFLFFVLFLVVGIGGASAGQYDYVVPPEDLWSCFDYAMHYSQENPEWGMVVISTHSQFIGMNRVVNYQINEDKTLLIHDEFLNNDYMVKGWEFDSCTFDYYYFYVDGEKPTRRYNFRNKYHIKPNAEDIYNAL